MIFDTHAHYDDEQFDEDRSELLNSMKEGGVGTIVNVSASVDSWTDILKLSEEYPFVYGAIGVHPDHAGDLNEVNFAYMEKLLEKDKVVAVGEIGLDYYWDKEGHDVQIKWFKRQLDLAVKYNLPVIIHSREAAADTFEIMKEYASKVTGVIHCYSYSPEQAKEYIKMGFYIGIGGVVTFKNAKKLKEVVDVIPLDKIVLETDCPYLSPEPNRGKRNSSLNLAYVADQISKIKGVTYEEVINITEANAKKMYHMEGI